MNPAAEDVLGDVETASEQGADVLGGTIGGTQKKSVSRPSDSDAAACVDQCGAGDQSGADVLGAASSTDVRARAHDAMNVPSHTTSASALAKLSSLPTADGDQCGVVDQSGASDTQVERTCSATRTIRKLVFRPDARAAAGWSGMSLLAFDSLQRLCRLPGGMAPLCSLQLDMHPCVEPRDEDWELITAEGPKAYYYAFRADAVRGKGRGANVASTDAMHASRVTLKPCTKTGCHALIECATSHKEGINGCPGRQCSAKWQPARYAARTLAAGAAILYGERPLTRPGPDVRPSETSGRRTRTLINTRDTVSLVNAAVASALQYVPREVVAAATMLTATVVPILPPSSSPRALLVAATT